MVLASFGICLASCGFGLAWFGFIWLDLASLGLICLEGGIYSGILAWPGWLGGSIWLWFGFIWLDLALVWLWFGLVWVHLA